MPAASADQLPGRKSRGAGEERLLARFQIKRRPAAAVGCWVPGQRDGSGGHAMGTSACAEGRRCRERLEERY